MSLADLRGALRELADPAIASHSQRFFKTGHGEYGEGDKFLGLRVPVLRAQAKAHRHLALRDVTRLLKSRYHEERLCALLILVRKFADGTPRERKTIYALYLKQTAFINNWDLVDSSAHQIVGGHLLDGDRSVLYELVRSDSLWERRIAMMATYHFIKRDQFGDTLALAACLLDDEEDLIHKVVGWMLREVGKRDAAVAQAFLDKHYPRMPRTMLRYAIEKYPEALRQSYLRGER